MACFFLSLKLYELYMGGRLYDQSYILIFWTVTYVKESVNMTDTDTRQIYGGPGFGAYPGYGIGRPGSGMYGGMSGYPGYGMYGGYPGYGMYGGYPGSGMYGGMSGYPGYGAPGGYGGYPGGGYPGSPGPVSYPSMPHENDGHHHYYHHHHDGKDNHHHHHHHDGKDNHHHHHHMGHWGQDGYK